MQQNYVVTNRVRAGRPHTRLSRCRARARSTRPWRSAVRRVGARECRSGWIVSHSQVVPNSNLKAYCDWLGLAGRREAIFVNIASTDARFLCSSRHRGCRHRERMGVIRPSGHAPQPRTTNRAPPRRMAQLDACMLSLSVENAGRPARRQP